MNEQRLRQLLAEAIVPGEAEADERCWQVIRAAFAERQPVTWPRRHARLLLVFALLAAALAGFASPPGRAFFGDLRDAIGREPGVVGSRPALTSLPAPGRLLVVSAQGAWIVQPDGSRRLLGDYEQASWSPQGLFVVAVRGRTLTALDPEGNVRWSLSRDRRLSQPRWAASGFRIAYRAGSSLRVVVGNGTGDRLLAASVAPVASAWQPGSAHVLAYVDARGQLRVVDTDSGRELWRTPPLEQPRSLEWSADGTRLLVLTKDRLLLYRGSGRLAAARSDSGRLVAASFRPHSHELALIIRLGDGRGAVLLSFGKRTRTLFTGHRLFGELAWSPDGHWLLVSWPAADQWLFLRVPGVRKVVAVSSIRGELDPGGRGSSHFPALAGWCC